MALFLHSSFREVIGHHDLPDSQLPQESAKMLQRVSPKHLPISAYAAESPADDIRLHKELAAGATNMREAA
jgi:hypothetical protein